MIFLHPLFAQTKIVTHNARRLTGEAKEAIILHNKEIACSLLEHAVDINPSKPFKFSSGLLSPIYCDNRRLISYPKARENIISSFAEYVLSQSYCIDAVAGTATAGIAWAAWLADRLRKPMLYVRQNNKKHGQCNRIEGQFTSGQNILLIEDLISTGSSALSAASALRESGLKVTECLTIMHYGLESAIRSFQQHNLNWHSLTHLDDIVNLAEKRKLLTHDENTSVKDWQKSPENWNESRAKNCKENEEIKESSA